MLYIFLVFFVKQKTEYEMRISDWSSDVCSSDLSATPPGRHRSGGDRCRSHMRKRYASSTWRCCASDWPTDCPCAADRRLLAPDRLPRLAHPKFRGEIGRASCREGVCQSV